MAESFRHFQTKVSRARCFTALALGTVGFLAVTVASQVIPEVFFGGIGGLGWAAVGLFQLVGGLLVVIPSLQMVGLTLSDVGLHRKVLLSDVVIGLSIAIPFALLQFLVIIPATGGSERTDVAANVAQLGTSPISLIGFIILAWTGAAMEEVFFRGHFLNTLSGALGNTRLATIAAAACTIILFALLHGYQGWPGIIDTGLYGGLTLTALYLWKRRLLPCIVAHSGWNTIAATVLFFHY